MLCASLDGHWQMQLITKFLTRRRDFKTEKWRGDRSWQEEMVAKVRIVQKKFISYGKKNYKKKK